MLEELFLFDEDREPQALSLSHIKKTTSVAQRLMAGPNTSRKEGEYFIAKDGNSFGLPSVDTCPGRTPICELNCYAIDSEKRDDTSIQLQRNLDILLDAETIEGMAALLCGLVDDYRVQADKLGIQEKKRQFRIHWSGDFFSLDYAQAWRIAIEKNPDIKFFAFTRSFQSEVNVVPVLNGIPNLDLFLSVDYQNVERAAEVLRENPETRVAYLVEFEEEAQELIEILGRGRDQGYRFGSCPENMYDDDGKRRLPLIQDKGGACSVCTYCIGKFSNWDVIFVSNGREIRSQTTLEFSEPVPIELTPKPQRISANTQSIGELAIKDRQPALF